MKLIAAAVCALSLLADFALSQNQRETQRYISSEINSQVKERTQSWVPFKVEKNPFLNKSDSEIQQMFGLKEAREGVFKWMFRQKNDGFNLVDPSFKTTEVFKTNVTKNITLPASFDSRKQWPDCIHPIRNQYSCGSCWAFASAGFLEDRFCIASGGLVNVTLSPQDMVTCDLDNGGCSGGYLTPSIIYLISEGLTTEECMPYNQKTGYCTYQCVDPLTQYQKYSCMVGSIEIPTTYQGIMTQIQSNGPMMVGFTIYTDFISYSGGIYQYATGIVEGGHAVKILGWDYDSNGRLYWICQNQWGPIWGESGFFNIYAGQAGLDSAAFACLPNLY